jgi:peroxiredoxin
VSKAVFGPLFWVGTAMLGCSLVLFFSFAHGALHALPEPAPEVAVGRALPNVSLPDEHGRPIALSGLRGRPAVFLFYRGAFCPSCRAQLVSFAKAVGPFLADGVAVFGVSPDPPDVSVRWQGTLGGRFPLLSDDTQRLAESLCGARAHCVLVVDPSGVVRWGALNDSWREGARPETILQAARGLRVR